MKIQKAKTDSTGSFSINDEKEGIANLVTILSELTDDSKECIVSRYQTKGYAAFKKDLAEIIANFLDPIQTRYHEIRRDRDTLSRYMKLGRDKAMEKSKETMVRIRNTVGMV